MSSWRLNNLNYLYVGTQPNFEIIVSIIHSTSTTPPEIVDVFENLVPIVENNIRNEKDRGGRGVVNVA